MNTTFTQMPIQNIRLQKLRSCGDKPYRTQVSRPLETRRTAALSRAPINASRAASVEETTLDFNQIGHVALGRKKKILPYELTNFLMLAATCHITSGHQRQEA